MSPTQLVLRRPLSATLALLLFVGFGWLSLRTMPRQEDPDFVRRGAMVVVRMPGASPELLDTQVVALLEDALVGVDQLEFVECAARPGIATARIKIDDRFTDTGDVWQRVRARLDQVVPRLPAGASRPVLLDGQWDTFAFVVALSSPTLPASELDRLAEGLGDHLRGRPGAGEVERFGAPGESIEVRLDPNALRFHQLTMEGVAQVLAGSDVDAPAGATETAGTRFSLRAGREFARLEDVEQVALGGGDEGQVVRLGDVASLVRTETRPLRPAVLVAGHPAIVLGVKLMPGFRVDRFTRDLREALAGHPLPAGVAVEVLLDQGAFTEQRMGDLMRTLLQSVLAVTFITALFLGLLPGILVASVLPVVALITLGAYRLLGLPIEQISISALILSMGLLIDNAIVVAEHLTARIGEGGDPYQATVEGVAELRMPLLMSTLTTVSAFLPVMLMPGGAGEFVRSIAVGVTTSLLVSYLLALTYTPALTLFFHRYAPLKALRLAHESRRYRGLLEAIARRPGAAAGLLLLLFVPLFGTFTGLERDFFPASERAQLLADAWLEPGTPRREALAVARRLEGALRGHPSVRSVACFVGESAPRVYYNQLTNERDTEEFLQFLVNLEPGSDPSAVARELDQVVPERFPTLEFLARPFSQGPPYGAPIEVRIVGTEPRQRRILAERVQAILKASGILRGVRSDVGRDRLDGRFLPDEATLARLGLSPRHVADVLRHRIDGVHAADLREGDRRLPVVVRGLESGETTPGRILRTAVAGGTPLASLGVPEVVAGHSGLARRNGLPTLTVLAWPAPGLRPAEALAAVDDQLAALHLPPGYRLEFGGERHARSKSEGDLFSNLYLAVMGILLALFMEFEDPRLVAMILWTVPLSVAPALAGLWLTGQPLGFMAILGILSLTGIVLNDAILLVDGFERARERGQPAQELVVEVTLGRTNHVLLTSLTTIAGFLPLALGGGEFWAPLSIAVISGLSMITVLTLLLVPALYLLVGKSREACPLRVGLAPGGEAGAV